MTDFSILKASKRRLKILLYILHYYTFLELQNKQQADFTNFFANPMLAQYRLLQDKLEQCQTIERKKMLQEIENKRRLSEEQEARERAQEKLRQLQKEEEEKNNKNQNIFSKAIENETPYEDKVEIVYEEGPDLEDIFTKLSNAKKGLMKMQEAMMQDKIKKYSKDLNSQKNKLESLHRCNNVNILEKLIPSLYSGLLMYSTELSELILDDILVEEAEYLNEKELRKELVAELNEHHEGIEKLHELLPKIEKSPDFQTIFDTLNQMMCDATEEQRKYKINQANLISQLNQN